MPRKSSIAKLDPQVRDLIGKLSERGRTLDEILGKLSELLPPDDVPSRSALHRHLQGLDEIAAEIRRTKAMAEALVRGTEDEPESKVAQLNMQLAHSILLKSMAGDNGLIQYEPQEAMFIASAIQKLTSAAKTDQELRAKIRREVEAEMAKSLDQQVAQKGLTAEQAAKLKAGFLGMKV